MINSHTSLVPGWIDLFIRLLQMHWIRELPAAGHLCCGAGRIVLQWATSTEMAISILWLRIKVTIQWASCSGLDQGASRRRPLSLWDIRLVLQWATSTEMAISISWLRILEIDSECLTRDWIRELPSADYLRCRILPIGVAVGDFNGDGHLDIVTANSTDSTVSVLLGTGSGSFQPQATFAVGSDPYGCCSGRLQRRWPSRYCGCEYQRQYSECLARDWIRELPDQNLRCGYHPYGVAVGDFNGDGNLDIVAANRR